MKGAAAYRVEPRRIRYMNFDEECQNKGNDENALLELYVSKRTDLSHPDADKNMTYRAYNILYDYWRNKKMILLDKVFQGKVGTRLPTELSGPCKKNKRRNQNVKKVRVTKAMFAGEISVFCAAYWANNDPSKVNIYRFRCTVTVSGKTFLLSCKVVAVRDRRCKSHCGKWFRRPLSIR